MPEKKPSTRARKRSSSDGSPAQVRKPPADLHQSQDQLELAHSRLEIAHIELEAQMQEAANRNAELQATREELEHALTRYTEIYDFAPVGYVTLDEKGTILSSNLE